VAALIVAITGCNQTVTTVPVAGKVQYEGKPLVRASVTFLAQDAEGRNAHGSTDDSGVFELSTFEPGDGAMPGSYKVTIQAPQEVNTTVAAATPEEAQQAISEGRIKPKAGSIVLSPRYTQPDQTVLTQEVPSEGEIVFDLKKNP
jgi:hypothetical protein